MEFVSLSFLFKVISSFLVIHLVFLRLGLFFYKKWFYSKQNIPLLQPCYPYVGSFVELVRITKDPKSKTDHHAISRMHHSNFGNDPPPITNMIYLGGSTLFIHSPEILEDLYIKKNKFTEKDPLFCRILRPLLGNSFLVMASNEEWSKKRKSVSQAFYKDKLVQMIDDMNRIVQAKLQFWEDEYEVKNQSFDLVQEMNALQSEIIMNFAFGQNAEDVKLPYIEDGKMLSKSIGQIIRDSFMFLANRIARYEFIFLPYIFFMYSKKDREFQQNIKVLRTYTQQLIDERKKFIKQYPNQLKNDLLSILIQDELFYDNDNTIIDECITFFAAGSQTVKVANTNIICYLIMNPEVGGKLFDELKEKLFNPYKLLNKGAPYDISKIMTNNSFEDLHYYQMCFNESLRIEPPVVMSMDIKITENTELMNGRYKIQKGDTVNAFFQTIHHHPDYWVEPERFIPERFDKESKFYLQPDGKKRHPLAFTPFMGGKRICVGKTFAEIVSKQVVPGILGKYFFEFENKDFYTNKPILNIEIEKEPVIMVKLKRSNIY